MNESTLSDNDIFLNKIFSKHVTLSIISTFGVMASIMANSIIAGQFFGADGLVVMSVAAPFYFIFATIGSLTGVGGSTLTSYAIYHCPQCGNVIDRDLQAAMNLKKYGESL